MRRVISIIKGLIASAIVVFLSWGTCVAGAQALPPELRIAGISQAEHRSLLVRIHRAARREQASEAALTAVAQRIGELQSGRVDVQALLAAIDREALRVRDLEVRLTQLERATDPVIAELRNRASDAFEQGRLGDAENLLLEAAQSELDSVEFAHRRAADLFAAAARTAELQFAYSRAAPAWARAAENTPESDVEQRWQYRMAQGAAMARPDSNCDEDDCQATRQVDGSVEIHFFASPEPIRAAIALTENEALPLAPRAERPLDWAETQFVLGQRYSRTCSMGGDGARSTEECRRSMQAFMDAYETLPVGHPKRGDINWRLSRVAQSLGPGNLSGVALESTIGTLERVFSYAQGANDTFLLQEVRSVLGRALVRLGAARRDENVLRRAAVLFQQELADPNPNTSVGDTAFLLGSSLSLLHEIGAPVSLERAEDALNTALAEHTRDGDPDGWAAIHHNLGLVLRYRAEILSARANGDLTVVRQFKELYLRAAAHFEQEMTVWTRERDEARYWALFDNFMAMRSLGFQADPAAAPEQR